MLISHNLRSMQANRNLKMNATERMKRTKKLSSGYRINSAADDAAGLQISEKMRLQIRGLERGEKNIMEGVSWIQVADGAMNEATAIVQRIHELAVHAANGTLSESDRAALDDEITELKNEINQISDKTVFNEQKVFDKETIAMEVEGDLTDLQIYDASYDAQTGKVTYGGIIFQGNRIPWDTISPNMVEIDSQSGMQVFKAGSYSYRDAKTGAQISFLCEEGAKVPEIARTLTVSANQNGVNVDGKLIPWSQVKDENGAPCINGNYHEGEWNIAYDGVKLRFSFGMQIDNAQDMIKAVNSCKIQKMNYNLESAYSGTYEEKAVDMQINKMQYSNVLKSENISLPKDITYILRAGKDASNKENGIWLEKADGTKLLGSYKTWAELGITSWEEGDDINKSIVYQYADIDGDTDDTMINFSFQLSDITSVDSVIDGLDGVRIEGTNFIVSNQTESNVVTDSNLLSANVKVSNDISHEEEDMLGRDYNKQKDEFVKDKSMEYDSTNHEASLTFNDSNGNSVVEMKGDVQQTEKQIKDDLQTYLEYIVKIKTISTLSGTSKPISTLEDLLGSDKVTTNGYFSEILTLDKTNMEVTDGAWSVLTDGRQYPAAVIDFSDLGNKYKLEYLDQLGFNSTCKTCSNHYSIKFVTGGGKSTTTTSQYQYTYERQGEHYMLEIDLDSLAQKGVTTGADLTKAIVEITKECYDFHYTQYAASGDKLYIFDERSQSTGASSATFDTSPYEVNDEGVYQIQLKGSNNRQIDASYTYNFSDFADNIVVEMKTDTNGEYVKLADNSYEKYNSSNPAHANQDRYTLSVSYTKKDANGVSTVTKEEAITAYMESAMEKMLQNTKVTVSATDYTYVELSGDEKDNLAIGAKFGESLIKLSNDNGLQIQNSGEMYDITKIPRIAISTYSLNLNRTNVKTEEAALKAMESASEALQYLSKNRSIYGAYQNRLEAAYAINGNTRENLQASESAIRDADMASEMIGLAKSNILNQVGQAMLAHSNADNEGVLALL